ncbi:MAG TPA: nucleotidyltransferase family protein [Vicinamibacterales bacterium]|nr:nucleotidyltransferase family protein [Vicinamibacterales bacterium]
MQDPIVQEHPRDIAAEQAPSRDAERSFRPSTWPLLLRVASSAVEGSSIDTSRIASDTDGWAALAGDAEAHGLAPLAHFCLAQRRDATPEATMQQLDALMLRHRLWHRERTVVLEEILEAFQRASIDTIVLKGAALAWTIYPSPALRPMSDIDLLVPPAAAPTAQLVLRRLRFEAEVGGRRFGRNAHHLPIASRSQNGVTISVEIHRDALSRDTSSSISMSNLTEPARPFGLGGTHALALGHVDTLRHLTHHLLEPSWSGRLRLIGLVDLLRYGLTFNESIDWNRLESSYPFVTNAMGCLHYLIPLPAALARYSPPSGSPAPARAGETIRPLRAILASASPTNVVGELFRPPDWWLHAFYGVPPDHSLTGVRLGRHPWRVARWLGQRASGF